MPSHFQTIDDQALLYLKKKKKKERKTAQELQLSLAANNCFNDLFRNNQSGFVVTHGC